VQTIFRGQRDTNWLLQSTWEREFCIAQKAPSVPYFLQPINNQLRVTLQREHLKYFRHKLVVQNKNLSDHSDDGLWAFGRHHGLITPLLDWTSDYRIAAYFAFSEVVHARSNDDCVAIWAIPLNYDDSRCASIWDDDRFPKTENLSFEPIERSACQEAQHGVFTRLSHPIFGDLGAYLDNVCPVQHSPHQFLMKIELPAVDADSALNDLKRDRVTQDSVFPPEAAVGNAKDWHERIRGIVDECNQALKRNASRVK